jgi:hypothetical protein
VRNSQAKEAQKSDNPEFGYILFKLAVRPRSWGARVKVQYFGDVNDNRKYALLRLLALAKMLLPLVEQQPALPIRRRESRSACSLEASPSQAIPHDTEETVNPDRETTAKTIAHGRRPSHALGAPWPSKHVRLTLPEKCSGAAGISLPRCVLV